MPPNPYVNPTVTDFQDYFVRDFTYGSTPETVMDQDIINAESDASEFINYCLFTNQSNYSAGFLQLSAHFLVLNLRAGSQGLQGQWPWMQTSKSVGNVSEGFTIPQRILDNPEYAMLTKTYYGSKFLFMILPQLSGQIFTVYGRTNP